jgi:hypothetical protein
MYKQCKDSFGNISNTCVQRLLDNAFIPMNEQNTDYQQYLKDVENGAEVLPADE